MGQNEKVEKAPKTSWFQDLNQNSKRLSGLRNSL